MKTTTTKPKAEKKHKYYTSGSFMFKGKKQSFQTQLYQIGVYCIWNSNSAEQGSYTPAQMQKLCKHMQTDADAGIITDLEFGREIIVTTEDGFFKEIKK
jgi:hypothetical protein